MNEIDVQELTDEVEELAETFPPGTAAAGLEEHARRLAPGEPPRAELLRVAAEHHQRARSYADAARCADAAVADGGPTWIDPRVELVTALLVLGDPRVDTVLTGLRRDLGSARERDVVLEAVADELHTAGRHREAARWYSLLLVDVDPDELERTGWHGAARRRLISRQAVGAGTDRWDQAAAALGAAPYPDWTFQPAALLVWGDDQLRLLLQRWPDLGLELGATPEEHHERASQAQSGLFDDDEPVGAVWGDLEELLAHAAARGTDPRHGQARSDYAGALVAQGRLVPWSPPQ